jgi:DNA-binding LacI/PurR family transcriptional regulator
MVENGRDHYGQKPYRIGIVTNQPDAVFQQAVIGGVKASASAQPYAVSVLRYDNDSPASLEELGKFDGLVVLANVLPDTIIQTLYEQGMPISLVSHHTAHDQRKHPDVPAVVLNNADGIAALVKHLVITCGRRDLVFIRGLMAQNDSQEREMAFRQELIRYQIDLPESAYLEGNFSAKTAAQSLRSYLDSGEKVTGVVASDYVMAISAATVLRESGYAVPEAVSVVGFGDNPEAERADLTTVAANITELGACAARQLISQINGVKISGTTVLGLRLIVRNT